jgi:hypothetical protein
MINLDGTSGRLVSFIVVRCGTFPDYREEGAKNEGDRSIELSFFNG